MSRVGNQPITLPVGVEVTIDGSAVTVKGPKGSLNHTAPSVISVTRDNGNIKMERSSEVREHRELHGLTRSLVANMVEGVSKGFSKTLDMVGVGYRVQQKGNGITLSVMFSHTVDVDPLLGTSLEVEGNNLIHVRGIDKQMVGQVAAQIRKIRPPNVYTGKGIRYAGEVVRLKPGKAAARK